MIQNLHINTGKSLGEWIAMIKAQNLNKHGEIIKFSKEQHAFTHGFANLVAHKTNESDAASAENADDLIIRLYEEKEHFRPMHEQIMNSIQSFGNDIEIAPKNAYVSLRRKKQFGIFKSCHQNPL